MTATRSEPSKGAWTPGPWEFKAGADNMSSMSSGDPILGSICDVAGEYHIARIWSDVTEAEANAKLISKAPEMAELLSSIIESATDGRECPEWLRERLQPAERLLSELEGKG